MAQLLREYPWNEELFGGEVCHGDEAIIVEGSDVEDSPGTKAKRQRRREAIGRRYLLGHMPLIQTAALRGPFDFGSAWTNPWKRLRRWSLADQHLTARQNGRKAVNRGQVGKVSSKTSAAEIFSRKTAMMELHGQQLHDDTRLYDADNESDDFEEIPSGHYDSKAPIKTHNSPSSILINDKPPPVNCKGDLLQCSEGGQYPVIGNTAGKGQNQLSHTIWENSSKRKAHMSWLKGTNISKRSRYESLEHSSPTPAAGMRKLANKLPQTELSTITPGIITVRRYRSPQSSRSPKMRNVHAENHDISTAAAMLGVADRAYNLSIIGTEGDTQNGRNDNLGPKCSKRQKKSKEVTTAIVGTRYLRGSRQISDRNLSSRNENTASLVCQEEDFDHLGPGDIDGLYQATRLPSAGAILPMTTRTPGTWRLDVKDLSISDMSADDIRSLREAQRLSNEGAISGKELTDKNNKGDIGDGFPLLKLEKRGVLAGSNLMAASRDTASPASDESFQYRRTKRRSRASEISPIANNRKRLIRDDLDRVANEDWSPKPPSQNHPSIGMSQSAAGHKFLTASDSVNRRSKKRDQEGQNHDSSSQRSNTESEVAVYSSPDPLSEDFLTSSRHGTTPSSSSRSMVDKNAEVTPSLQSRNLEGHKMVRGQYGPISLQDSGDDEQYMLQPVYANIARRQSTNTVIGGCLDLSASLALSEQPCVAGNRALHCLLEVQSHVSQLSPGVTDSAVSTGLYNIGQSPLTAANSGSGNPESSLMLGLINSQIGGENNSAELCRQDNSSIGKIKPLHTTENRTAIKGWGKGQEEVLLNCQPLDKFMRSMSEETTERIRLFPSTQNLVDAATMNPWNSAFKKLGSRRNSKRVSFGPLPSDEDDILSSIAPWPTRLASSPPPATPLIGLEDPFHQKLDATEKLQITMGSSAKSNRSPWDQIPTIKLRANPPLTSPAVNAMAEAFIAADRQSLSKRRGMGSILGSARVTSINDENIDNSLEHRSGTGSEIPRARSSSPFDESFSIAPDGKVTAVNVDITPYDADSNLEAVIDDMGSFLEGWDVDSELKKAKGNRLETVVIVKDQRRRGYLSGVLNR